MIWILFFVPVLTLLITFNIRVFRVCKYESLAFYSFSGANRKGYRIPVERAGAGRGQVTSFRVGKRRLFFIKTVIYKQVSLNVFYS